MINFRWMRLSPIEWPILYIYIYIYNIYTYVYIRYQSLKNTSWVASGVWTKNLPILIQVFYPARPLPQILKLIRYLTRNIFMEKICRKPAIKTSSMCLFNFANSPKQPLHAWDFWKKLFLKEIMKKVTWFFPLHPVTF